MRRNPQEAALQDLFLNTHRYISSYNTYRTPSLRFGAHIFLFQGARDMREDCPSAHGHALVQGTSFSLPRNVSPFSRRGTRGDCPLVRGHRPCFEAGISTLAQGRWGCVVMSRSACAYPLSGRRFFIPLCASAPWFRAQNLRVFSRTQVRSGRGAILLHPNSPRASIRFAAEYARSCESHTAHKTTTRRSHLPP